MLLVKTFAKTPKQRWKRFFKIFYYGKSYYKELYSYKKGNKKSLRGTKLIYGIKFFNKRLLYKFYITKIQKVPSIITNFGIKKNSITEYATAKNLFNQLNLFLHTEALYPGFILFNLKNLYLNNYTLAAQYLPLRLIPINTTIIFIFNKFNQYAAFAKSSGCNAIREKIDKKYKLIYISLPSKKKTILHYNIYCVFSKHYNKFFNKIVEGGWGFTHKIKKLISVRGVAKNPVDHPNGGRTKAKQPELSPWGWIAKHNK